MHFEKWVPYGSLWKGSYIASHFKRIFKVIASHTFSLLAIPDNIGGVRARTLNLDFTLSYTMDFKNQVLACTFLAYLWQRRNTSKSHVHKEWLKTIFLIEDDFRGFFLFLYRYYMPSFTVQCIPQWLSLKPHNFDRINRYKLLWY